MGPNLKEKTCCFTGHRVIPPETLPTLADGLDRTLRRLIQRGIRYFGAGGALGFDTLAAEAVLGLKKAYPHIRLILVLPCPEQTRGWAEKDIRHYEAVLSRADKVVYTSAHYGPGCMHRRNRRLVDGSGVCVAYCTRAAGGSAYTVDYARRQGVSVINLAELV